MNLCSNEISETKPLKCEVESDRVKSITIEQLSPWQLKVTKVIYNYKAKTDKQIQEAIQLEIDTFLANWSAYKFVNSKSHFNNTGGIEMVLNFEKV